MRVFTIPAGFEFIGFRGKSGAWGWADMKLWITCATPANLGITFDLTNINGKFQAVSAGATVSPAFTVTDTTAGVCGTLVYSVSVTPTFTTGGLISVPNPSTAAVQFLASTNTADINQYTVTVSAYYSGSLTACPASASATYSYVAPGCSTSTMVMPSTYGSITAQVGSSGNWNFITWRDSISQSSGTSGKPLWCGPITYKTNIISAPATYVDATMGSMFTYTNTLTNVPPKTQILVSPTVVEQIGTYSITTTACLDLFPSICATSSP